MSYEPSILFSTYFPRFEEVELLIESGIRTLYYFGAIEDIDSHRFFNLFQKHTENDFEFINLKK